MLDQGDPESLRPAQRIRALEAYVARYGRGGWRGLSTPRVQIHRFASPELGDAIGRPADSHRASTKLPSNNFVGNRVSLCAIEFALFPRTQRLTAHYLRGFSRDISVDNPFFRGTIKLADGGANIGLRDLRVDIDASDGLACLCNLCFYF